MSNLTMTIAIAFALIIMALIGVGIGWLITGKNRVRHCGMNGDPQKKGDCKKNVSCPICEGDKPKSCDKKSDAADD